MVPEFDAVATALVASASDVPFSILSKIDRPFVFDLTQFAAS